MDGGGLVSDEIIIGLVRDRLREPDCRNGYLFDGFPRTIPQADAMRDAGVALDYVLEIDVPDAVIIERMSGRRCPRRLGTHLPRQYNPPKVRRPRRRDRRALDPARRRSRRNGKKRLAVYHAADRAAHRLLPAVGGQWRSRGAAIPQGRRHGHGRGDAGGLPRGARRTDRQVASVPCASAMPSTPSPAE